MGRLHLADLLLILAVIIVIVGLCRSDLIGRQP
jgi:Sec-independent protein translocase protein TatA